MNNEDKKIFEYEDLAEQCHLRIYSKKLLSGSYQLKFYLNVNSGEKFYGYLMAEPKDTVTRVVNRIFIQLKESYYDHRGSRFRFDPEKKSVTGSGFMLFRM